MAILIIEQQGKRQAGTLKGRVLIGRWTDNTVVIDDRAVSRIHAWVGLQDGRYYIADAGSRTGTFINGQPLRERHILQDGDQIRIGPAVLRYRIDSAPPSETQLIDLSPRPPAELSGEQGIFMDCVCGAPLWLPREFEGVGQCKYCGHTVTQTPAATTGIPKPVKPTPRPPALKPPTAPPRAAPSPTTRPRAGTSTPSASANAPTVARPTGSDDFDSLIDDALASPSPDRFPKPSKPAGASASPPASLSETRPSGEAKPTSPAPRAFVPPKAATGTRTAGRKPATGPAIPPVGAGVAPLPPAAVVKPETEKDCGVCHAGITIFDEVTVCPSCGLFFHTDCWNENRGCSAFGCSQVGALEGKDEQA